MGGGGHYTVVTQELIALATVQLGTKPLFWGRYFKGPGDQNPVRYQAQLEGLILNSNGIRVLPIAQQTNNVALDQSTGHRDGLRNGAAIVSSFGQIYLSNLADGILVFLDVEGPPNPSLSILALFSIVPLTMIGTGQMALYRWRHRLTPNRLSTGRFGTSWTPSPDRTMMCGNPA